jgi:hypothetical protein
MSENKHLSPSFEILLKFAREREIVKVKDKEEAKDGEPVKP